MQEQGQGRGKAGAAAGRGAVGGQGGCKGGRRVGIFLKGFDALFGSTDNRSFKKKQIFPFSVPAAALPN